MYYAYVEVSFFAAFTSFVLTVILLALNFKDIRKIFSYNGDVRKVFHFQALQHRSYLKSQATNFSGVANTPHIPPYSKLSRTLNLCFLISKIASFNAWSL